MSLGRIDNLFQFNQAALNLRAARQELIAANIANADTPNYKARDIDFASALQGALSGSGDVSFRFSGFNLAYLSWALI